MRFSCSVSRFLLGCYLLGVMVTLRFFFSGSVCVVYIRFRRNKMLHNAERVKKVVSDSPGLVDFAIGPVNLFLTCPTGK